MARQEGVIIGNEWRGSEEKNHASNDDNTRIGSVIGKKKRCDILLDVILKMETFLNVPHISLLFKMENIFLFF